MKTLSTALTSLVTLISITQVHGQYAPPGLYVVTAKLPERDGEFEYRIKHTSELHERIAKESDLHEARR